MSAVLRFLMALTIGLAVPVAASFAQEAKSKTAASTTKGSAKPKTAKNAAKKKSVSAEREAELLEFVGRHHPELATLLEQLKPAQATEYRAAIADLDREVRRLEQIRKRSPAHYDFELQIWIARSRIRLLSARLSVSDDPELREALKEQLRDLRKLEIALLSQQIETVQQNLEKQQRRLEKLQQRKSELETNDEDWLARQVSALEQKQRNVKPPKKKPASGLLNAEEGTTKNTKDTKKKKVETE